MNRWDVDGPAELNEKYPHSASPILSVRCLIRIYVM